jgi:phage terminase large subunit GpA-like protein
MSSSPNASLQKTMEIYLEAKHREASGDITGLIEFTNNQLGLAFKYKSPVPKLEVLEGRGEDYAELTVPWAGLRLSAGVDVQGDRVALTIVAWGRGEESWRVYWGDLLRQPDRPCRRRVDRSRADALPAVPHASGRDLYIERFTVDSGDGNTSDAVYAFCRKWKNRGAMAGKGRETGEIFRVPQPIDPGRRNKAAKYGLTVYQVGTEKAKDLLLGFSEHGGRLSPLRDEGRQDRHRPRTGTHALVRGIRKDYFPGLTSEIKGPKRGAPRHKLYWQQKSGARNEPLDCEVYALHASRAMRVHLMTEAQWQAIETSCGSRI